MNIVMTNRILAIAAEAHAGQVDLAGAPYIEHLKRVARNFNPNNNYPYWVTAILHDILEDTETTVKDLEKLKITRTVIKAVIAMTKLPDEDYKDYLNRVMSNDIATRVKMRDLEDNMNISRLSYISTGVIERLKKYHKAYTTLKNSKYSLAISD